MDKKSNNEKSNKRDWSEYNEKLVRRGEFLLTFGPLNSNDKEIEDMNKGKVGAPFKYSNTFILFLGFLHVYFSLPYRQLEGFINKLSDMAGNKIIPTCDYTTICWRINRLKINFDDSMINSTEPITIAIDSTGIKMTNSGDDIVRKWGKKKPYLKLHIAVDINTKQIVSFEITDDRVHDNKKFKDILEGSMKNNKVKKAFGDGAYDSKGNFKILEIYGVIPGIKVRENSVLRGTPETARDRVVKQVKEVGYKVWANTVGYGHRWIVELPFQHSKECLENM